MTARRVHPTSALEYPSADVTVSFRPAILPWCSHVNCVKENAVCTRELLGLGVPTNSFPWSAVTKMEEPKYWTHRSDVHYRRGSFVRDRNARLTQRAPKHHVAENEFGAI